MNIYFAIANCSLGKALVAESQFGVCAVLLGEHKKVLIDELNATFTKAKPILAGDDVFFKQRMSQVINFIDTPVAKMMLPLDIQGTLFQLNVWKVLCNIPLGQTLSYADLAKKVYRPNAVRAVANACHANRLAVLIPCHRVICANGKLSGYRWGIERKCQLLEKESKHVHQ